MFLKTGQEIPYSTAVIIESFQEDPEKGLVTIHATIVVEKDSQKGIVIGKGGLKLQAIGTAARRDIEEMLDQKVLLKLWVKVKKNWSQDERFLKELGFLGRRLRFRSLPGGLLLAVVGEEVETLEDIQGGVELVVVLQLLLGLRRSARQVTACLLLVLEMVVQICLAQDFAAALTVSRAGGFLGRNLDIRGDAQGLNGAVVRGVVLGGGHAQAGPIRQGNDCLHRSLAEGPGADNDAAFVVLDGPGDYLRGAGGTFIDQDDHRHRGVIGCRGP